MTLPHDYMIGSARKAENATGLDLGYFEPGFGVYRKTFEKPEGETVLLSFDGAMGLCEVSLNGSMRPSIPTDTRPFSAT